MSESGSVPPASCRPPAAGTAAVHDAGFLGPTAVIAAAAAVGGEAAAHFGGGGGGAWRAAVWCGAAGGWAAAWAAARAGRKIRALLHDVSPGAEARMWKIFGLTLLLKLLLAAAVVVVVFTFMAQGPGLAGVGALVAVYAYSLIRETALICRRLQAAKPSGERLNEHPAERR